MFETHKKNIYFTRRNGFAVLNGSLCFRSSDTPYRFQVSVSRRNISKVYWNLYFLIFWN